MPSASHTATVKSGTVTEESLTFSQHAELRFQQRVSAVERHPREAIREIVERGHWVTLSNFNHPAKLHDGVAVVVDRADEHIVTVVKPKPWQLEDDNPRQWQCPSCGSVVPRHHAVGHNRVECRHCRQVWPVAEVVQHD